MKPPFLLFYSFTLLLLQGCVTKKTAVHAAMVAEDTLAQTLKSASGAVTSSLISGRDSTAELEKAWTSSDTVYRVTTRTRWRIRTVRDTFRLTDTLRLQAAALHHERSGLVSEEEKPLAGSRARLLPYVTGLLIVIIAARTIKNKT